MKTHSSYKICPKERKLLFAGYLLGPRQDVRAFPIHDLIARCGEYCEMCVRPVRDAEREPQKSHRMAAVSRKWEVEKSLAFRWPQCCLT